MQDDEDENAEAEADMEEGKLAWAGGRKEAATYDDGDEEDRVIAHANRDAALKETDAQVPPPHRSSN